jgi:GT2 family glycosyltransferase
VFVVDATSSDGSVEVATKLGATVIRAPNRGLGSLYNLGSRATTCDYVLCSNNDVAYEPSFLEHLAAALDADENCFAADPTHLDWSGDRVIKARTTLTRSSLLHEYVPGLHIDQGVYADSIVPTVFASGAAMLVRRRLLLELEGFDETFFLECEDLDVCWRAWLHGWTTLYVPQARLRHRVSAATAPSAWTRRRSSAHHNMVRFALKCLPAAAAGRAVGAELLRLPRHPREIGPALLDVAGELGEIRAARIELGQSGAVGSTLRPRGELLDWMLAGQPG